MRRDKHEVISVYCPLTKSEAKEVTKLFTRYFSIYMQYAWWLSEQIVKATAENSIFVSSATEHYNYLYQDLIKKYKKVPGTPYYGLLGNCVRDNMHFMYGLFYRYQKEISNALYDMDFKAMVEGKKDRDEYTKYISSMLRKHSKCMHRTAFSFPLRTGITHVARQASTDKTITIPGIKLTVPVQNDGKLYYERKPNCVYFTLYHNRNYRNRIALYVMFHYKEDGFVYLKPSEGSLLYHGAF